MSEHRPLRAEDEERLARGVEVRLQTQRRLLTDLMHSDALAHGDLARAVQQLTETATSLLRCQRASVWRLCEEPARIECIDLFDASTGEHQSGAMLFQADIPRYFGAIAEERSIVAHDACCDPRTDALRQSYLEPLGITAILDAPVFVRGKLVAVVCHEHVATPRRWLFWEELLAGTCSDFVAQVLEAHGWLQADRALRAERDELERKVAERTAELRALLAVTPVALVLQRLEDQRVLFLNPRAEQLFAVEPGETESFDAAHAWADPARQAEFLAGARAGHVEGVEAELCSRAGTKFWARISSQRISFDGHECYLATFDDITSVKQAEARLREQATRDPLTSISNRRDLLEHGANELDRARRYGRHFSAALLDIDRFKLVNDAHGHAAGDAALMQVVELAQRLLRASDLIGRWGGEEFVVLLPETDLAKAATVLDRIRAALADTKLTLPGGAPVRVTVSIGVAEWTGIEGLESLVERADAACYQAKRLGRNRTEQAAPR
ncbi:MAG: diguanylate cyclase [Polyangia bacterium]